MIYCLFTHVETGQYLICKKGKWLYCHFDHLITISPCHICCPQTLLICKSWTKFYWVICLTFINYKYYNVLHQYRGNRHFTEIIQNGG